MIRPSFAGASLPGACLAAACAVLLTTRPAPAAQEHLRLTAGNMLAQTHSQAVILDITGTYRKLSGRLDFDLAAKTCTIDVTFDVGSLSLPLIARGQVMSKGFLDPAQYPTTHYRGTCTDGGTRLDGRLTMRGETHPFAMKLSYVHAGGHVVQIDAAGSLDRYDWGLNGLKMLVGRTITVTNAISLTGRPPHPAR